MKSLLNFLILFFFLTSTFFSQETSFDLSKNLDLESCINYALKNHPLKQVNTNSVGISESQLKQAHSAYWPELNLTASASMMDESPNFIFPSSTINVFGGSFEIPEQDVKLLDKTLGVASLELVYPLYTGGYISSLIGQAEAGLLLAKEEARKNELQIVADVKKRFYSVLVMQNLVVVGDKALGRLEATLDLTENLYLKGSGTVTKADYLKNKVMVDNVRSINSSFKHNLELAQSALLNAIGEKVGTEINVVDENNFADSTQYLFDDLLSKAFAHNPTWKTLEIAETIFENKVDEAFSGHLPKVGLMGSANYIYNDYSYGMVTDINKLGWTVGLGVQLPLFNGFRTSAKVDEANFRLGKIKSQKMLLENGMGILVKKALIDYHSALDQKTNLKNAMDSAIENSELNDRAYQSDLVELEDLLEAQLFEAIMEVQFYNACHTFYQNLAELEFVVGTQL